MKSRVLRLSAGLLLAGLALLATAVVWHNWGDLLTAPQNHQPPLSTPETLQRGSYLVRAGNCMACHTARGGAPLAGGRAIDTPFGAVYSSNLTPDTETGLGRWSAQDFWNALHHGRSRGGRLLAPAFPYEHTSLLSREDTDAMFAWLRSQSAVRQAQPESTLAWPLGTQPALAVWRTLFFTPQTFTPDARQSAEWNRGAWLVQGLGHCAACHSARNAWGASEVLDLSGGMIPMQAWYAPSLAAPNEASVASWSQADVVQLLATGRTDRASTLGPMAEAHHLGEVRLATVTRLNKGYNFSDTMWQDLSPALAHWKETRA